MKICEVHDTRYRKHCVGCTRDERQEIRAEQATFEKTKKQTAEDKEKTEGFLSRVFLRKKDKKRDSEIHARNIGERGDI